MELVQEKKHKSWLVHIWIEEPLYKSCIDIFYWNKEDFENSYLEEHEKWLLGNTGGRCYRVNWTPMIYLCSKDLWTIVHEIVHATHALSRRISTPDWTPYYEEYLAYMTEYFINKIKETSLYSFTFPIHMKKTTKKWVKKGC